MVSGVQLEILEYIGKGQDVFASLSTGSGKSDVHGGTFVLQWANHGHLTLSLSEDPSASYIVIIVSPLVAIIKEQVAFLKEKGMKATHVGDEECDLEGLKNGNYNYVFGSPESSLSAKHRKQIFTNPIYKSRLGAIFIDESHCIVKW